MDGPPAQAVAEPITGIASMATRHLLSELAAAYQQRSGQRVVVESVGGVDAALRVESGEAFDFVVLAAEAIDKLAAVGRVDPDTRIDVARSGVAIAVRAGAQCPDVGTEQAVRDAVLAVRTIGYSTGPSGKHLARLFERWGIADIIAPRVVEAPPGVPVASLMASGKVELGFQQLSELIHAPGIQVIGTLPPAIQVVTVFAGAVCTASARHALAKAFLSFCATPALAVVKGHHGMEP